MGGSHRRKAKRLPAHSTIARETLHPVKTGSVVRRGQRGAAGLPLSRARFAGLDGQHAALKVAVALFAGGPPVRMLAIQ